MHVLRARVAIIAEAPGSTLEAIDRFTRRFVSTTSNCRVQANVNITNWFASQISKAKKRRKSRVEMLMDQYRSVPQAIQRSKVLTQLMDLMPVSSMTDLSPFLVPRETLSESLEDFAVFLGKKL